MSRALLPTSRRVLARLRPDGRRAARPYDAGAAAVAPFLAPLGPADRSRPAELDVVLLNDCRDQVNFGASVLVDGLIELLGRSLPHARVRPVPSHWLLDVTRGFGAFVNDGRGLAQPRASFPRLADQFDTVADAWQAGRGGIDAGVFLDRLAGADAVVLNGEGSLYRRNQSAIRELFLAWFARERLHLPTVFVNGMVHLTDVEPILPGMVRRTFGVLDAVAVREAWSLRNLAQYAPEIDAQVFPDSAFVLTPDAATETPAVQEVLDRVGGARFFCFDPGPMPMDHGGAPGSSALHKLIARLKQVVPQAVLVNSSPDDTYIERVAHDTGSVYVDSLFDYREYMGLVARSELVVSGRYHNPILAGIVGCPAITFASANHKVHGACEMLDHVGGPPYDGTNLLPDLEAIAARAADLVADRAAVAERLMAICARRREEVAGLGELVASVVPGRAVQ